MTQKKTLEQIAALVESWHMGDCSTSEVFRLIKRSWADNGGDDDE